MNLPLPFLFSTEKPLGWQWVLAGLGTGIKQV